MNQVKKAELIRLIGQVEQGLRDEQPNRIAAYILYACAIIWLVWLVIQRSAEVEKLSEYFVIMGLVLCLSLVVSHWLSIAHFKNLLNTRRALETIRTDYAHQEVRCTLQDSLLSITWRSVPYETTILLVNQLIERLGQDTGPDQSFVLNDYLRDLPEPTQEIVRVRCREIHHQAAEEIQRVTGQEIRTHELACTTTIKASVKTMEEMKRILGMVRDIPNFTTMGLP